MRRFLKFTLGALIVLWCLELFGFDAACRYYEWKRDRG